MAIVLAQNQNIVEDLVLDQDLEDLTLFPHLSISIGTRDQEVEVQNQNPKNTEDPVLEEVDLSLVPTGIIVQDHIVAVVVRGHTNIEMMLSSFI